MKKVLFVATVTGHINAFHIPYLELLKKNGYEVHVATGDNRTVKKFCDKKFNISIKRKPFSMSNIKAIKELKDILEKEKYEMIHCHTPMGGVVARIAAKKTRKKYNMRVIYTAHGFHFYKGAPIKNWLLFYPVEWYLSKYTDVLVTINGEDYKIANEKFRKRCKNIRKIPGIGVDEKKIKCEISEKEKNKLQRELQIKEDDFVIIYPARLCKDKNQILLLQLMKRLNNNSIKLILPGVDELNGFYQRYVKDNHLENVEIIGDRNDIPKLLKISDLLIASSIREGFGLNLVEALSNEIPVIAVDNRGHREIIEDGYNGFIIKNDINDLVEKFNLVYNDRDLYTKLKSNGKKSAKKYYLQNSLKKMKEIYKIDVKE